jgi:RNA polymerase sigma-70 factor (ECF subfamily)
MSESEAHWIKAARRGDTHAFRRLVELHARSLHHACHRLLGDAAAAEDALQEALISAWRGLDRFDGRSAFGSWLHRIAINAALMQLRQRRAEISFDPGDESDPLAPLLPDDGDDPFERVAGDQAGLRLATAMGALSAAERSAFAMRHFEHYPLSEIADVLGCNVNACKQAIFRAVRKLRLALAPMRSES